MRYYISDLHFYHANMNTRMDKRGFESVEAMNEYMISQWNKKVRKNDEVVILGDFSIDKGEKTNELLRRLNARKYLIIGNHDRFLNDKDFETPSYVSEMIERKNEFVAKLMCNAENSYITTRSFNVTEASYCKTYPCKND